MIKRLLRRRRAGTSAAGTDAIVWAYRLFLDREPESDATVERMAAELSTSADIRRRFVSSAEYRERIANSARPSLNGHEPPMQIEHVE